MTVTGRRRLLALLPAAAAAGLAACAAPPIASGPALPAPRVGPGDRWRYHEINRYNGLVVSQVEVTATATSPLACRVERQAGEGAIGAVIRHGQATEERYSAPWNVLREPTYDLVLDFAAPMPLLPAELRVGASRRDRTTFTVAGYPDRYEWVQWLRATGIEQVSTPAGTFECLVVRRQIRFDYPDPFRRDSMRYDTVWYAPAVNRWVVREWTGDYMHDTSLDDLGGGRRREDWVRWELLEARAAG